MRDNRHPNRVRLEDNRDSSLKFAREIIKNGKDAYFTPQLTDIPKEIALTDFSRENLTQLAMDLDINRDFERNIIRYEKINADDTKSLVRDARGAVESAVENRDPNSVMMQVTSTARAALFMLDHYKVTLGNDEYSKIKIELNVLFNQQLKNFKGSNAGDIVENLKNYNAGVLLILQKSELSKISDLKIKEDLGITMHSMNFLNTDYHITTITKGLNNSTIIESDIMMLGVTDNQMNQLKELKGNKSRTLSGRDWYDTLSPYKRELARFSAENILNDKDEIVKKVPTQLRNLIPFGKNMYTKFTYLKEGENDVKLVAENAHNGAIYYGRKTKDLASLVKDIAEQASTFTPTIGTRLNQVITVSPNNPTGHEKEMTDQSRDALKSIGGATTITPLNLLRKIYPIDDKGYKKILSELAQVNSKIMSNSQPLNDYLTTGRGKKAAEKFLKNEYEKIDLEPKEKAYLDMMRVALDARVLLGKKVPLFEKFGNDNLKLYEYFSELNAAIHTTDGAIRVFVSKSEWNAKEMLPQTLNDIAEHVKNNHKSSSATEFVNYLNSESQDINSAKEFIESIEQDEEQPSRGYRAYINILKKALNIKEVLNEPIKNIEGIEKSDYNDLKILTDYLSLGVGTQQDANKALVKIKENNKDVSQKNINELFEAVGKNDLNNKGTKKVFDDLSEAINDKEAQAFIKTGFQLKPTDKAKLQWYEKIPYLELSCASGKDRTGISMVVATTAAVVRQIGEGSEVNNGTTRKKIAKSINDGGHVKIIPSQNDIGTHGIMPNTALAEKGFDIFEDNSFTCETARTNKFTTSKIPLLKRIIDKILGIVGIEYKPIVDLKELDRIGKAALDKSNDKSISTVPKENLEKLNEQTKSSEIPEPHFVDNLKLKGKEVVIGPLNEVKSQNFRDAIEREALGKASERWR